MDRPKDIDIELAEQVHKYSLDIKSREIYLIGDEAATSDTYEGGEPGVEFIMANRFIKNLRTLELRSADPILVHMKTCGGFWEEGMAIYDAIKFCPAHVTILSYTHARSMSSIILQAADHRVLMPHSYFLYHYGTYEFSGEWLSAVSDFDWTHKCADRMIEIYAEKMKDTADSKFTRWGLKRIKEKLKKDIAGKIDVFLSAEEAVDYGLADTVFDGDWESLKGTPKCKRKKNTR